MEICDLVLLGIEMGISYMMEVCISNISNLNFHIGRREIGIIWIDQYIVLDK